MADEREEVTLRALGRWLVLALVVLTGLGLYVALGRDVTPVVEVPALELAR
jgi:hypothetical protein